MLFFNSSVPAIRKDDLPCGTAAGISDIVNKGELGPLYSNGIEPDIRLVTMPEAAKSCNLFFLLFQVLETHF